MEVRIVLESLAAASASQSVIDDDIKVLDALLHKMKRFSGDPKRFATLDIEFHLTTAKFSRNPLLSDMISMIQGQLVRGLSRVLMIPNAVPLSLKQHLRIFEAIRRYDSTAARDVMGDHLSRPFGRYRKFSAAEADTAKVPAASIKKRVLPKRLKGSRTRKPAPSSQTA
jgi:GntR family transcriptional repressor for pyruvate dehydrogenase complex